MWPMAIRTDNIAVLKNIGRNLVSLMIAGAVCTERVQGIVDHCPNLQKLELIGNCVKSKELCNQECRWAKKIS